MDATLRSGGVVSSEIFASLKLRLAKDLATEKRAWSDGRARRLTARAQAGGYFVGRSEGRRPAALLVPERRPAPPRSGARRASGLGLARTSPAAGGMSMSPAPRRDVGGGRRDRFFDFRFLAGSVFDRQAGFLPSREAVLVDLHVRASISVLKQHAPGSAAGGAHVALGKAAFVKDDLAVSG